MLKTDAMMPGNFATEEKALSRLLFPLLKNSCRNIDTPGRLGGEEFLVVLPETTLEAAGTYAERVRSLVERLGKRLRNRYPAHALTISVGITSFNQEEDDLDSLVRRVDNAKGRFTLVFLCAPEDEPLLANSKGRGQPLVELQLLARGDR